MKKLLFLVVLFALNVTAQTNFSFTPIPTTSTDLIKPGAGLEYWIYQSVVPYPTATSPSDNGLDRYDRFEWRSFENGTQGVYNWIEFDNSINTAISKKQKFSFGIMSYCESCTDFATSVGGATLTSYPPYLHTLMQAEVATSRDWVAPSSNTWIPNYNSINYLDRHKALLNALAAHIAATSYNGVPYSRVIRYIDVRGIGNYNEWHHYGYLENIPTGRFPTIPTYKRVVDDYIAAFPNFQLVALSDGYDTQGSSNTPAEVVSYLLTASNNVGKLGYRRDNIGSGAQWVNTKLENNPAVWNGVNLKDSITTRWKTHPAVGEPMGCCSADGGSVQYFDLSRQVSFYHINSMGNGNFEDGTSTNTVQKVRDAAKLMGYRYYPSSGSMTTVVAAGVPFNISVGWRNGGNSPTYERWFIDFSLRNTTNNVVVWTGTSSYNLRALLPLTTETVVSEVFTLPTSVASGTYRLHMTVRDSSGYRDPMPLFISGVQSDGSYILRDNITIGSVSNNPPTVNAGIDQIIVLPTSSTTLAGSGTDTDGSIASYLWTKVTGSGGVINSPSTPTTSITDLIAGTYTYRLTVTDNNGLTAYDDVQIVVNSTPIPPPVTIADWLFKSTPNPTAQEDGSGVTLGFKFRVLQRGAITRIRFWKTTGNTGTHIGGVWSSSGILLSSGIFANETASGWQYLTLKDTIFVEANKTYIAAYYSPRGSYAINQGFFRKSYSNTYITAPASITNNRNGLYKYGSTMQFPNNSFNASTYWVDVEWLNKTK